MHSVVRASLALALGSLVAARAHSAQAVVVEDQHVITAGLSGFVGPLEPGDFFGSAVASPGDLDGDGIAELAVGAVGDDAVAHDQGAVWILFLRADGTVRAERKLALPGAAAEFRNFGGALAPLGDFDGDGVGDLAVGARETVWLLFLRADGSLKDAREVPPTDAAFGGAIAIGDRYGTSVACAGDVDGDGTSDLAVGCEESDAGGDAQGAVWIVFLLPDGGVRAAQEISASAGGFAGDLDPLDLFGSSVASPGDLDGDGRPELAVGARWDDDGGRDKGALWVLFLEADGTVRSHRKISATSGGFGGTLGRFGSFGTSCAALGDVDGDGLGDLAAGAPEDFTLGYGIGAVWVLCLDAEGGVRSQQKLSGATGGIEPYYLDGLGVSVAALGDLDGDGLVDLAAGQMRSYDSRGSVWTLRLDACLRLDFETEDDFATPLVNGQHFDTELGRLVALAASGPNAGACVFDSTVGGPNDPSQDPDLLVGRGNVLVLQTENYPPDANDVFPRPNDDEDGGTLAFSFATRVELAGVRVIDHEVGDGALTLVLSDEAARTRTYSLPGGWTGDRLAGAPGERVLDLTSRVAQAGFESSATVEEEAGFDPDAVRGLEVRLQGSGAIDELAFAPEGMARARASSRNGSGRNPERLATAAAPVLGRAWTAELDCAALGGASATLVVRSLACAGAATPLGERLVEGALLHVESRPCAGGPTAFTFVLPADVALLGVELHVQGLCRGAAAAAGRKAFRPGGVLTNALDLRLGF